MYYKIVTSINLLLTYIKFCYNFKPYQTERGYEMNLLKLKAVCVEKGITNKELSVLWGCSSRQTVTNKRTGRTGITLEEAQKFSEYAHLTDKQKIEIFLS